MPVKLISMVISPIQRGYFPVSHGHRLYYEVCGNPKGRPLLFLHGGPGVGFSDSSKRFFDMKRWKVVLFDQRGAGRSKPQGSINANTTDELVSDINGLLDFLKINVIFLFGGSWGSTLALVYAIRYPERVLGILLRGIFLCNKEDMKHYLGSGVKTFFPEAWERFVSHVPQKHRQNPLEYYLERMQLKDPNVRKKYAYEWAYYESSIIQLTMSDKEIRDVLNKRLFHPASLIEAYYLNNHCFFPDNYILKNASRLVDIPVSIVHGRYDMVCPPANAYLLHKALPHSRLFIVTAGHASSEPEIEKKLKAQLRYFSSIST